MAEEKKRKFSEKVMAARIARFIPEGTPRYIHVYDNGGKTADRYTVVYTGRYRHMTGGQCWYVGMSGAPFHPQGVCQHGENDRSIDYPSYSHLGKKIGFADLPDDCRRVVIDDYCDLWDLDKAKVNALVKIRPRSISVLAG